MREAVMGGPAVAGPPVGTVSLLVVTVPTDTDYFLSVVLNASVCCAFFSATSSCAMRICSSASVCSTAARCLLSLASALLISWRMTRGSIVPPCVGVVPRGRPSLLHVLCQTPPMSRMWLSRARLPGFESLARFLQYMVEIAQVLEHFSYRRFFHGSSSQENVSEAFA